MQYSLTPRPSPRFGNRLPVLDHLSKISLLAVAAGMINAQPSAFADVQYWNGTSGTWNVATNWGTTPSGTPGDGSVPTINTDAVFNTSSVNNAETIGITAASFANSLTFNNTGGTLIQKATTGSSYMLTLGPGGVTMNAGAAAATIGGSSNTIAVNLAGSQTWSNLSSNALTISNAFAAASGTPSTLTFTGNSAGGFQFSNSVNDGASGGVLSLVVNMTGSGIVSIPNNNPGTYSGGTIVKSGTLRARVGNLGTGAIALGDTSGNANATLTYSVGGALTTGNNITTQAGTTGALTLANGNNVSVTDANTLTLNNTNSLLNISQGTGSASFAFTGSISGAGGISNTAGALTLSGNNTYAGGTVMNSGVLNIDNGGTSSSNSAIGTGTLTLGAVTINNTSGAAVTLNTNNAQVWNGNFTFTGSDALNLGTGSVSLGTAAGVSRTATISASSLIVGGAISNGTTASGLTKAGSGTMALGGANTYTGTTTISAGTLLVNGSHTVSSGATSASAYSIGSGAFLGGSGSIDLSAVNSGVTIASGGKLAPGASIGKLTFALGAGVLNASAAVGGANAGALIFALGSAATAGLTYDQVLLASGSLNIGSGVLDASDFSFTQSSGFGAGVYTLFDTSSTILGSLGANLSVDFGSGVTGTIGLANAGQDIVLTVVPEPSTWQAMLGGIGVLAGLRMLRRTRKSQGSAD